jgi:hypothetical protein
MMACSDTAARSVSNAGAGRLAHHIDHERIAARAYEIYESRQREDGHADEDWRQAEAEYAVRRANDLTVARGYGANNSAGVSPSGRWT